MSKHTTLEQLKMLARRTKREIDKVDTKVDDLAQQVDDMATIGGEPNVITEIKNNTASLPVINKGVDIGPAIAEAVAAADHLTRKVVTSMDEIDLNAENAGKFIYMVPKTDSDEDDVYDEYMVLNGAVEHVGNTKVDLSGYVQKEEGAGLYPDTDKEKLASMVMAENSEISKMLDEVFGVAQTDPETPEVTAP